MAARNSMRAREQVSRQGRWAPLRLRSFPLCVRLLVRFPFGRLGRPSFGRLSIWALPLLEIWAKVTSLQCACAEAVIIGCFPASVLEMVGGELTSQTDNISKLRVAKEAVLNHHCCGMGRRMARLVLERDRLADPCYWTCKTLNRYC